MEIQSDSAEIGTALARLARALREAGTQGAIATTLRGALLAIAALDRFSLFLPGPDGDLRRCRPDEPHPVDDDLAILMEWERKAVFVAERHPASLLAPPDDTWVARHLPPIPDAVGAAYVLPLLRGDACEAVLVIASLHPEGVTAGVIRFAHWAIELVGLALGANRSSIGPAIPPPPPVPDAEGTSRQDQVALRRSHRIAAQIPDALPMEITLKDDMGRILFVNTGAEASWGRTRESLLGMTVWDLHAEEEASLLATEDDEVLRTGTARFRRFQRVESGVSRELVAVTVPTPIDDVGSLGLLTFVVDASDLLAPDPEQVRLARERDALVEAIPDRIVRLDRDGTVLELRDPLASGGSGHNQWLGVPASRLFPPEVLPLLLDPFDDLTPATQRIGEFATQRDNDTRWIDVRVRPGLPGQHVVFLRDVTLWKQRVVQAVEDRQRADAALRIRAERFADAARRMQPALASLRDAGSDAGSPDVRQAGDVVARHLSFFLDASALDAGQLTLEAADFGLHDLLRDTLQALRSQTDPADVAIRLLVDDDVPAWVRSDPARIRQCILALLDRLLEGRQGMELHLHVRVLERNPDRITIELLVEDSTDQPPLAELHPDFDPEVTWASGDLQGTGALSVLLARQLAELLGGSLSQGTGVPKVRARLELPLLPPLKEPGGVVESPDLDGWQALIAVMSPADRNLARNAFASCGAQVVECAPTDDIAALALQLASRPARGRIFLLQPDARHETATIELDALLAIRPLADARFLQLASHEVDQADPRWHATVVGPLHASTLLRAALEATRPRPRAPSSPVWPRGAQRVARVLLVEDDHLTRAAIQRILERAGHEVFACRSARDAIAQRVDPAAIDLVLIDTQTLHAGNLDLLHALGNQPGGAAIPIVGIAPAHLPIPIASDLAQTLAAVLPRPIRADLLLARLQRLVLRA